MKCEECKYWQQTFNDTIAYGICRRYPKQVSKNNDDYCGEFKVKVNKEND